MRLAAFETNELLPDVVEVPSGLAGSEPGHRPQEVADQPDDHGSPVRTDRTYRGYFAISSAPREEVGPRGRRER